MDFEIIEIKGVLDKPKTHNDIALKNLYEKGIIRVWLNSTKQM